MEEEEERRKSEAKDHRITPEILPGKEEERKAKEGDEEI